MSFDAVVAAVDARLVIVSMVAVVCCVEGLWFEVAGYGARNEGVMKAGTRG
jgi:hypothetical protein